MRLWRELMAKLVWRVKLVTELQAGETTEVEVARIECDEQAGLSDLGLRLAEAKQLTSALHPPRAFRPRAARVNRLIPITLTRGLRRGYDPRGLL